MRFKLAVNRTLAPPNVADRLNVCSAYLVVINVERAAFAACTVRLSTFPRLNDGLP